MTTIADLEQTIAAVTRRVAGSIVGVAGRRSAGSGVVLAPGRVLTNAHNVSEAVQIVLPGGSVEAARPVGVDADGDLAVLETPTGDASPLEWSPRLPTVGSVVFGVADPGGRGLRVTLGFVSGVERAFRGPRGRRIAGSIEHTAPLLPGSSGGPIVDGEGRVLGLNTHRLGEGFYLAIPADDAFRARVDGLGRGEVPARKQLGVAVAPPHVARRMRRAVGLAEVDGLLVRALTDQSAAAAAGVEEGDLIVAADGRDISTADDLHAVLDASGPTASLRIIRGTEERTIEVRFDATT